MPNNHTITPHLQDEDAEANCSLEPGADQLDHKCRKCNLDRTDKEWQWEGSPMDRTDKEWQAGGGIPNSINIK